MFEQKTELLKPIIYENDPEKTGDFFGTSNRLYSSLINLFETFWIYAKKELYLVGGCVRDMLLGKEPKDYDLCTNATPDEVKKICKALHLKTFDSGIKHGTVTIIDTFYHQSYEITTYRCESEYSDSRHPDKVEFVSSLEEDLKRRDFTINSFAYNLLNQTLMMLDKSYLNDLEYGIIRTVGRPCERFHEDALRMLRALRFSAQLNFTIAKDTYHAIEDNAELIAKISKERIRDELTKILLSDNPQVLELITTSGLEDYLFGIDDRYPDMPLTDYRKGITPFKDMLNCDHQSSYHYTDVFHHTIDVVKRVPKRFELRWAALLHDIGKPAVKQLKEGTTDKYTYFGHQEVSAEMALGIMEMLKFSNNQKELIYKYIKYHDYDLVNVRKSKFKTILVDIGVDNFLDFIKLRAADSAAHRLIYSTEYAIDFIDDLYERFNSVIIKEESLTLKDLKVNGNDLIKEGLHGKEIGECLNLLLELVLEYENLNNKETLLQYVRKYKEER